MFSSIAKTNQQSRASPWLCALRTTKALTDCSYPPPAHPYRHPVPLKNIKRPANTVPVSPIRTHPRQARISAPPASTPQQPRHPSAPSTPSTLTRSSAPPEPSKAAGNQPTKTPQQPAQRSPPQASCPTKNPHTQGTRPTKKLRTKSEPRGGSGGSSPRESTASPRRSRPKGRRA